MSVQDQKTAAAEEALLYVEDGMALGLGTGSTAALFVAALARRKLRLRLVATSRSTADLALSFGMQVEGLDAVGALDLTVDGADEIGPSLSLIKGGGGALLHEKLVWSASRRCIVIADEAKEVPRLGAFKLPIEVVHFAHEATAARIRAALNGLGFSAPLALRQKNGAPVLTDSGNVIYDAACGEIQDPAALGSALKALTGVVDHGLFLGLADLALIGTDKGVRQLKLSN